MLRQTGTSGMKYRCLNKEGDAVMGDARIAKIRELQRLSEGLQAQVAVLRGALEEAEKTIGYCSHCRTDNRFTRLRRKLLSLIKDTPAEASERVNALVKALERISCKRMDLGGEIIPTEEAVWAMSALAQWRRQT